MLSCLFPRCQSEIPPTSCAQPQQRRGRPCSQGWSSGASGLFLHRQLFCTTQGQLRANHPKSLPQKLEKHPTEIPSSPSTPTDNKIDHFPKTFCWQGHHQLHTAASTVGWGGGEKSRAEQGCCTKHLKLLPANPPQGPGGVRAAARHL